MEAAASEMDATTSPSPEPGARSPHEAPEDADPDPFRHYSYDASLELPCVLLQRPGGEEGGEGGEFYPLFQRLFLPPPSPGAPAPSATTSDQDILFFGAASLFFATSLAGLCATLQGAFTIPRDISLHVPQLGGHRAEHVHPLVIASGSTIAQTLPLADLFALYRTLLPDATTPLRMVMVEVGGSLCEGWLLGLAGHRAHPPSPHHHTTTTTTTPPTAPVQCRGAARLPPEPVHAP